MIIEDSFEQRSPEWYKARLGIPTASQFSNIISTKGSPSKSAEPYMYKLATDKIRGYPSDTYISKDMQAGIDKEPMARGLYSMKKRVEVQEVALVYKNAQKNVSCSPDGLMDGKGLEIQCPKGWRHNRRRLKQDVPYEKIVQIQGSMWVCGFDTWDFMSFSPGLPSVIITVKRDVEFIKKLEVEMLKFIK